MENRQKQKGFTLLEVLLILFLLMVIISIAAPKFSSAEIFTRQQADYANRVRIEGAVELYRMDTGRLPEGIDDLIVPPPGVKGWRGPYIEQELLKPTRDGGPYSIDERGKIVP